MRSFLTQPEWVLWGGVSGLFEVPDQGGVLPSTSGLELCLSSKALPILLMGKLRHGAAMQLACGQQSGDGDPSAQCQPEFKERPGMKGG